MTKQISRRQFLKAAAAGSATAAFAPLFGFSVPLARAKQRVPERIMQQAATPTSFTALPSTLILNAPLADIAMGADGTLWGIDSNGVPYSYDHLSQTWEIYVDHIDALTTTSRWQGSSAPTNGKYAQPVVVMGSQITSPIDGTPLTLQDAFANLPTSFQLGLDGIAEVNGQLFLFRHGRYVVVDTSQANNPVVGSPVALTSLTGWPTTATWSAGSFQALGSCFDDPTLNIVHVFNNGEMLVVDLVQGKVIFAQTYAGYSRGPFQSVMNQGFSALTFSSQNSNFPKYLYQGGVQWTTTNDSTGDATPSYANVAQTAGWTPVLSQAPSGSASGLWAVTTNTKVPVRNTGSGWQLGPYDSALGQCTAISAGSDSAVFCLTSDGTSWGLRQLQQTGTWSALLSKTTTPLVQLDVGDANHIWVRSTSNTIYRLSGNDFVTVPGFVAATHLAANADGTVWAANNAGVAYRFISEGTADASPIPVGAGTVIKVASNAFAAAAALVQNGDQIQVHSYDSQYVWKTSASYLPQFDYMGLTQSMVQAGHTLFIVSEKDVSTRFVAALDTQTGATIWGPTYIPTWTDGNNDGLQNANDINLVYDTTLDLLYVGGGQYLIALHATTGQQAWRLDNTAKDVYRRDVWGPPSLSNGRLCVCDRWNGSIALVDTVASAAQGVAVVRWNTTLPYPTGLAFVQGGAPVFDPTGTVVYTLWQAGSNIVYATALNLVDGSQVWTKEFYGTNLRGFVSKPVLDAVFGTVTDLTSNTIPALFINVGIGIIALNPANGVSIRDFPLAQPPNGQLVISSALSYLNNQLFFGDTNGKLYVINALTLQQVTTTTDAFKSTWMGVLGRLALAHTNDPNDGLAVLFARGDANIWVFDPSNGALETIMTDQTRIASVIYDQTHGLLYGCSSSATTSGSLGQVFALRPDQAIQDERDFIIESQLMQDYHDDNEASSSNGNARYQTHVTVVDANTVPMSNTSIKLWAEEDGTVVSVDGGDPVTIGPNTPTLFTTDSSGSFTVISGGFASDGNDAADMFAVTLHVWAAFMDASERIVITPDAEFHGRVAATTASGTTDPTQADPTGIDLSSTQSYDKSPLFTTASTDQSAAKTLAGAMTQVTSAVGVSTGSSTALLRRTLGGKRRTQQGGATPPKYHAYTDLPGMSYAPVSALTSQALTPTTPIGISFTATGFATHTPGDAATLIDAMQGSAPSGQVGGLLSDIRSAWKEIKSTAAKVKQAAISIAKEVYVGITYVVNGVTKVIKAIAADIKDAMATIGAFFVQLGKDIKNAIEALSILLHFDEFIKTQKFIKNYYTTMIGRLGSDLDAGFSKLIGYLGNMSTTVKDDFTKLIGNLQGNGSTGVGSGSSSWGGYTAGTSPHTTMSVAPVDGSAPKQSVAVQGMWAAHKSRQNAAATTTPTTLNDSQGDIVAQLESLFSDPTLFSTMDGITRQFTTGLSLKSPQAFFDGVFADILVLIEAAILAGIDIVQGVVQKLQGVVQSIVGVFENGGSFTIPIITPLWTKLGLPQLEIIDLVTLIAAIPVTLIYRVLSGHWLSHDANSLELSAVGVTPPQWLSNAEGIITAMITLFNGFINAIGDTFSALIDPSLASLFPTPPWVTIAGYANMALMAVGPIYTTVEQNGDPLYLLVIGLNVLSNLMTLFWGKVKDGATLGQFLSWLLSLFTLIIQWIGDGSEGQPWETIVSDILANIPGCLSLLKYAEATEVKLVPPIADLGCAVAAAALTLAATIEGWKGTTQERDYRIYLPVVPQT